MVRQLDDPGIISGPHVNTMSALTPKGTCGSAIAMSANSQKQTQLQNKGSACSANSSANVVWQADKKSALQGSLWYAERDLLAVPLLRLPHCEIFSSDDHEAEKPEGKADNQSGYCPDLGAVEDLGRRP